MSNFVEYDAKKFFTVNGWPNYITTDNRLSPKSILILLFNKGQDPKSWTPRKEHMMKVLHIGSENTWAKYIRELISCGYLRAIRYRKKNGQYGTTYEFCLDPAENEEFTGELPEGYFEKMDYEERKIKEYERRKKKASSAGKPKKAGKRTNTTNHKAPKREKASKKTKIHSSELVMNFNLNEFD